jgi:hypothetical protein
MGATPVPAGQKPAPVILNRKNLKALIGVIWASFILIGAAVGFLIYVTVKDQEYKQTAVDNNCHPAPNPNYRKVNFSAIIFGSVAGLMLIVLVALTSTSRYGITYGEAGYPAGLESFFAKGPVTTVQPVGYTI